MPEVVLAEGTLTSCTFLDDVEAVAVAVGSPVDGDDELQPRAGTVDASLLYGIDLAELAERAAFSGAAGTTHTIDLPRVHVGSAASLPWAGLPHRIVFVGVGRETTSDLRRAGAALARAARGLGRVLTPLAATPHGSATRAFVEGYLLGAYVPVKLSAEAPADGPARELVLIGDGDQSALDSAVQSAWATWLVRDLATVPSNIKSPEWFADRAVDLATAEGLTTTVLDVPALEAQGFGGILAVGRGSSRPPRLVTVTYAPVDGGSGQHVVVVGKGITYDTGGLSIKPREAMVPMKTDMAGAAVALAAVLGASRSGSPHSVTAVLPLAENHVGAGSYRPGDVLRLFGGTTVEIANTDAEGRLVLADALAFADATLDPDVLVDVATLTGAASVGLGRGHAALFSADDALVAALEAAGRETGEPVWHMPLVEDYAPAVASTVADLRHVPADPPGGGAVTAALFLRSFVGERRWVHLDIAGPSRAAARKHEVSAGATGYGARLVLRLLETLD
ncbi:leucyl aminopeptidase family protein [Sanguibacter inulinus]|uniref:leucyl aminopeptidase family protein n=1 Tax=Sanguibacter inulinus TaxID=60922 RepID=UPI002803E3ED|nr:leucyl aminopeptidase family protein [Sanguibacter inulinus]